MNKKSLLLVSLLVVTLNCSEETSNQVKKNCTVCKKISGYFSSMKEIIKNNPKKTIGVAVLLTASIATAVAYYLDNKSEDDTTEDQDYSN